MCLQVVHYVLEVCNVSFPSSGFSFCNSPNFASWRVAKESTLTSRSGMKPLPQVCSVYVVCCEFKGYDGLLAGVRRLSLSLLVCQTKLMFVR